MKLLADRINETRELAQDLASGRKVVRADVDAVKSLIADETESRDKSARVANNTVFQEAYRRNMRVAVTNSESVIEFLEAALRHLRAHDATSASTSLSAAVEFRGKKAAQPRDTTAVKLYQEYQTKTDAAFHAWLVETGRQDVLSALHIPEAKSVPKTRKRTTDPRSNRPEDY